MRVLLDEDVPLDLRLRFGPSFQAETVQYRGWKGTKNGALLRLAEGKSDVLVTLDKRLPDQQNLTHTSLAVAILCPRTQAIVDLVALIPELERVLPGLRPGEMAWIRPPAA